MKKRLLAFLLVLVMVVGFVPLTANAVSQTPYIKSVSIGPTTVTYVDTLINEYSTEDDNDYTVLIPDNWQNFGLRASIADGINADNLYSSAYCGASKAATTTAIGTIQGIPLNNLQNNFWLLVPAFIFSKLDTEYWVKLVIGTGTTLEDPQTFYFRLVRSVALSSVTASDEEGNPLSTTLTLDSCFITYGGDRINLTCTAQTPAKAEIKIGDVTVVSGQSNEIDLTPYPLSDGVREIPVTVRYTGTGIGGDSLYTLYVDRNNYQPIVEYGAASYTTEKGRDVEISVTATVDKGELSYQWYRFHWSAPTGELINGADAPSYIVSPNEYEGAYRYRCVVTNQYNGNTFVTNPDLVWFTVLPTYASEASIDSITDDQLVIQYADCTLSVQATPKDQHGVLSYQWYVNTANSNQGGALIDGATESTITVDSSASGVKYYYCVVTSSLELTDGTTGTNSDAVSDPVKVTVASADDLFEGSGTSGDPYQLKTVDDYNTLQTFVNESGNSMSGVYFKQMADITLPAGWTPLGRTKDGSNNIQHGANLIPFSAHLDGGGHTLTIPAGNMPLLGYVLGAEVKNLTIYGPQINGYGLVNNFEGVGLSGTAITIDNVTLKSGTKTLKSGLLGGNITTNGYAATSAGYKAVIRNCTVESGVIVGYNGDQTMIGSIAGRFQGSITNCTSAATVKGTNYVGGIVGTIDNAMAQCEVSGCTFTGTVEASGDHAGGIMGGGYSNFSGPNGGKPVINNCSVSGTVTGANKVGASWAAIPSASSPGLTTPSQTTVSPAPSAAPAAPWARSSDTMPT